MHMVDMVDMIWHMYNVMFTETRTNQFYKTDRKESVI